VEALQGVLGKRLPEIEKERTIAGALFLLVFQLFRIRQ
jgi:hypothetical protein